MESAVVTTVVGIVASISEALLFFWIGKRAADRERQELMEELAGLRSLMASMTDEVRKRFSRRTELEPVPPGRLWSRRRSRWSRRRRSGHW